MIGMQTTTKIGGAIGGVPLDPVLGRDGAPRRPRRTFLPAAARPAATGDDGVANTLLRRGVAATLPASFGVRVELSGEIRRNSPHLQFAGSNAVAAS